MDERGPRTRSTTRLGHPRRRSLPSPPVAALAVSCLLRRVSAPPNHLTRLQLPSWSDPPPNLAMADTEPPSAAVEAPRPRGCSIWCTTPLCPRRRACRRRRRLCWPPSTCIVPTEFQWSIEAKSNNASSKPKLRFQQKRHETFESSTANEANNYICSSKAIHRFQQKQNFGSVKKTSAKTATPFLQLPWSPVVAPAYMVATPGV